MAKFIATIKAIITRLVFASHGFIAIWQVTNFKKNPLYWYLSCPILLLFFEGIFTLTIKANQEWKWFCPSVFLYLGSVVPAIWLLELDKVEKRMRARTTNLNISDTFDLTNLEDLRHLEKAFGVNFRLPEIHISTETWVTLIEQFLMLILIIGRWMLPKGDLTRDQLSQLLLVYIGTAADIIEFFDSFKEDKIARERVLVYLTLGIWSWSLMQFTVVLTATKSRKSRLSTSTSVARKRNYSSGEASCCSIDVWAIALNMVLQDGPFLAFRLILIVHYQIVSYMNIFFTCKNTLVILLQLYRLYVVQSESKQKRARREASRGMPSISVISRNDIRSKSDYLGFQDFDERRKRPRRSRETRFSDFDDSSEYYLDKYERSSGRNGEKAKRKSRQDTGYSTSSSRTSGKHGRSQKRENKKNSNRCDESRQEDISEDEKRARTKKTEKKSSKKREKKSGETTTKSTVRMKNAEKSRKKEYKSEEEDEEEESSASSESVDDKDQSESSASDSESIRHGGRRKRGNKD